MNHILKKKGLTITMTEARMNEIAAAFGTDEDKIKEIAGKSLDDAVEYFSKSGYDFTAEELTEFAKALQDMAKSGELSEKELENASGGGLIALSCAGVLIGLLSGWAANKITGKW